MLVYNTYGTHLYPSSTWRLHTCDSLATVLSPGAVGPRRALRGWIPFRRRRTIYSVRHAWTTWSHGAYVWRLMIQSGVSWARTKPVPDSQSETGAPSPSVGTARGSSQAAWSAGNSGRSRTSLPLNPSPSSNTRDNSPSTDITLRGRHVFLVLRRGNILSLEKSRFISNTFTIYVARGIAIVGQPSYTVAQ